jgi:glutathionyl-hydroquinone reductase
MTGDFGRPMRPPTALSWQDVREGTRFVTWRLDDPDSRREGIFVSSVYISDDPDYNESLVVDVVWSNDPSRRVTTEVASSLGLCHNRHTGENENAVSIENDGEEN